MGDPPSEVRQARTPIAMKPFSTYPEDRAKLLKLAASVLADDSVMVGPDAIELADLVRAILEDEAVAISSAEAEQ